MTCDFCCSDDNLVEWCHPAKDFIEDFNVTKDPVCESKGAWAACNTCHDLIVSGNYIDLALRSAEGLKGFMPEEDAIAMLIRLHEQFRRNQTDAPFRIV